MGYRFNGVSPNFTKYMYPVNMTDLPQSVNKRFKARMFSFGVLVFLKNVDLSSKKFEYSSETCKRLLRMDPIVLKLVFILVIILGYCGVSYMSRPSRNFRIFADALDRTSKLWFIVSIIFVQQASEFFLCMG